MTDVVVRIANGVADLPRDEWDACAGADNPFVSWDFLAALERSGSVGGATGWQPLPLVIDDGDGRIAAAAPLYAKSHSQGEYVFDHGWADAWERAGGRYYPKIQIAAPFSPVPGPRLLLRDAALAPALIAGIETLVERNRLSSAHATFVAPEQVPLFEAAGWLIREDSQFHWTNRGYGGFEDFLADLSSEKRKNIRKERRRAVEGLEIVHLSGDELTEAHWDIFWDFYQDTGARKWGQPYLTRAFFSILGKTMADRVLLMLALRDGRPIAGALNLVGGDTLYGRYWGCVEDVPNLHFELCYYQAIDVAIARGLHKVEAGAQGGHKLARGYAPEPTWSAHYIPNPGFRRAVAGFLTAEREDVQRDRQWLAQRTPFRKGD
ncbi:MAG: GNAT family N-acetyltransferase [Pseudomonadota bacterium]|nr:GNAT family N-acetyltransferase [Sphingobium naphthae]MEC7931968.1 GNAT family N-acetyltransferase [Pseudomonadota bacterium]MEC8035035.1 GNAT family N-acetyltransferase [Pseudomonadota bacterium]